MPHTRIKRPIKYFSFYKDYAQYGYKPKQSKKINKPETLKATKKFAISYTGNLCSNIDIMHV
jgi:hypothetical protein